MSKLFIRKAINRLGLLDSARLLKKRLVHTENEFKPGDPRTLISTMICLDRLISSGQLDSSDYLEFGIYRGFNLWFAQAFSRVKGAKDMRYFGFDSFIGIPSVTGVDVGGAFKEGDFSAYKDEVETWLTRFGVDWKTTTLIPGFFADSLKPDLYKAHNLRRCGLCVVDCDLYSSTIPVLRFVRPLLAKHSIIYFDDWSDFGNSQEKGEPLAFREFCAEEGAQLTFEPLEDLKALGGKGKAFVVASAPPDASRGEVTS